MDIVHHSLDRYPGSYVPQCEKFCFQLVATVAIGIVWMNLVAMEKHIGRHSWMCTMEGSWACEGKPVAGSIESQGEVCEDHCL
jgi:hypothetical protein